MIQEIDKVREAEFPLVLPKYHYVSRNSPIGRWCSGLGTMGGGKYGTWLPRFSIYHDGKGGPLYYVKDVAPFLVFTQHLRWEVLRLKSEEPNLARGSYHGPGTSSGRNLPHIGVHFNGYNILGHAMLRIVWMKDINVELPPYYLLHVVQKLGSIDVVMERRLLHLEFFPPSKG